MDAVVYIKMSELVDQTFKIEKVFPAKYKAWDNDAHKMLISDTWQQGYQKKYTVDTNKGRVDCSAAQIANMLEAVTEDGRADLNGRSFNVKSNGKTGMEIRYFFNPVNEDLGQEDYPEELEGWMN